MHTSAASLDLTKALPPTPPILDRAVSDTLKRLALEHDLGARIRLNRPAGNSNDREAAASWLSCRFNPAPPTERLIITNGTQSALMLILKSLAEPGDLIVSESLTYVVLGPIVKRLGMRLEGVELDDFGLIPEAFEAVCRTKRPKALYCNPTVQNPTASVMPEFRRAAIVDVARKYGVAIIEDDVIGALHGSEPRPIHAIAPDITWYCMSLSKCFAMGLRLAYVLAPDKVAADELVKPVQNQSWWFPSSLSLMVVEEWIKTGMGREITTAIHDEVAARQSLAAELLGNARYSTADGALHIWLRLPAGCDAVTFGQAAARAGVAIRPSNLFVVDDSPAPNAARISLSSPTRRVDLEVGLTRIAALLAEIGG